MKDKILANRVMYFISIYTILGLLLWIFALLFYVQFYNTFNMILFIAVTILIMALPITVYYLLYRPMRVLDTEIRRFNEGHEVEGLRNVPYYFTSESEQLLMHVLDVTENMQDVKMSNFHSEYRALQNQINPHFLYNTLEAIRSDAIVAGVEEIADITESLATFFRYSISNSEHRVTIEDELNNVNHYFKIQNYRFGDRITLSVDEEIDQSLLKTQIPKLTLQPIVENAIIHGLEKKVTDGHVTIKIGETQKKVLIDVIDDGVGMDDKTLERINNKMHHMNKNQMEETLTKGGIAMINVNNRIKLTFGESFGLRVSSVKDFGTTVNITLPKEE